MYIKDGIVYGGGPEEPLGISAIKILPDMIMLITFSNGETRLFDASILKGEVFELLKDRDVFEKVAIDHGIIIWAYGEIDCAPEYMYQNSYEYRDVSSLKNMPLDIDTLSTRAVMRGRFCYVNRVI